MAARGTNSKQIATDLILKTFKGSFIYDKEIRIPFEEEGEIIQLKCVLTCAKTNVEQDGDIAIPGEKTETQELIQDQTSYPTQEEKDNVKRLMETFGL